MRVLFYNWVDYLDDEKRGGGVTIYQRNVLRALDAQDGVEALFLSSGISYDLLSNRTRWERVRHGHREDRHRRFELVNSGVLAPAHHSFGNPAQLDEPATVATFLDFVARKGPFDVIHFNNLEGVPVSVLTELKRRLPGTKLILSLHNYYPICPQVNLWYHETENCVDFENGRKCRDCLLYKPDERIVRLANGVAFRLKKSGVRPGTRVFDRIFGPGMRIAGRLVRGYARLTQRGRGAAGVPEVPSLPASGGPGRTKATAAGGLLASVEPSFRHFAVRRAEMVNTINRTCDAVLCVSDRVGKVAAHFGIDPALLRTSYIGTREAAKFQETAPRPSIVKPDGTMTLAYLGYMRRDKGFFFLLEALEEMPDEMAAKINLVICARQGDAETMQRIGDLSARFGAVFYADGYRHDQLDTLLEDVDVGVVPVLWEDNLPQVAIEMHARHIPLLTSDLGGAQELAKCRAMTFKADSIPSFLNRIETLLAGKVGADFYWKRAMAPVSMESHVAELLEIYRSTPATAPAAPVAPAAAKDGPAETAAAEA